jgi:hypothetical protein
MKRIAVVAVMILVASLLPTGSASASTQSPWKQYACYDGELSAGAAWVDLNPPRTVHIPRQHWVHGCGYFRGQICCRRVRVQQRIRDTTMTP